MSYCPKCGNKITEDMIFCPKCGAPLKVEQATTQSQAPVTYRHEKDEKTEKGSEKGEKHEKREKREYGFIGPLIAGIIILFIGLSAYLSITGYNPNILWAFFLVAIGLLIVIAAVYGALMASRRHPRV
ncbi:MAG TPA: zinc-ribbon domain-containing protein [Candidatus Acidoferrum sp.]|nr:zinc-ribbon domain-containing protein [Candidatus Acidoferrum sp.]